MTTYEVLFYNVDNGRQLDQVTKELRALCDVDAPLVDRPALLGLCETTGLNMPAIDGFKLVRDTSRQGRANISAYVRKDLFGGNVHWVDLQTTWSNTQKPGTHWPRSYVVFKVGQMQAVVYHAAPKNADTCKKAQQEGIDSITAQMQPPDPDQPRPRLALADWNRKKDEAGPGPSMLAGNIGGRVAGAKIDAGVWRGDATLDHVEYPTKVNGVTLKSDHGHAYRAQLHADAKWWVPDQADDDVPYLQWPKADRQALVDDAADAVWSRLLMGMDDAPDGRHAGATLSGVHELVRRLANSKPSGL